ncbi:MAG: O-antigen ligase family protein [Chitinophagaceae bacterium]
MKTVVLKLFNYKFHLKEFLVLFFCYFLVEHIFSWIFIQKSVVTLIYVKLLSLFIYAFVLLRFKSFKPAERIYIGLFSLLILKLIYESLLEWGSIFQYFELYAVLFPVIFTIFIKSLLRKLNIDLLEFIAKFYLVIYVVFMLVFGRNFSLGLNYIEMDDYGPYSGDSRIIHAQSIFMMVVPFLWYLHKYVVTRKTQFLWWFLFCAVIILLHQHRSVWSSTMVATFFYIVATIRNNRNAISGFVRFTLITFAVLIISFVIISNTQPLLLDHFADRFSEILNPGQEESTSNFRFEQSSTYFKYIEQRPIFGWTFEGFELENPMVDWWPEKTGQHFHEGYIEMLFYHGIAGLLLKYSFLAFLLIKLFSKKLSQQSIILASFCVSGLVFSLSYVLPLMFWGHVGMCLCYLEWDKAYNLQTKQAQPQKPENTSLSGLLARQ